MSQSHLIDVSELSALLAQPQPPGRLVLIDCRFDLVQPEWGYAAYQHEHLSGAIYLSLDSDLSAPLTGSNGRHPLPSPEDFAATLARTGVGSASQVVVYDQGVAMMAARLWWMLRWIGCGNVRVLDGGLAAWQAAGLPLAASDHALAQELSPSEAEPLDVKLQTGMLRSAQQVLQALGEGGQILLDARAEERFRGDVEPLDPVAGHIPGALNRPFMQNLMPDGRFKSASQLKHEFETLLQGRPATQLVHQCGSGVSAAVNMLAMEIAGLTGSSLYAGSWSEWVSDPSRPVAAYGTALNKQGVT
ncbi:sulfurtransferase [Vandammella animalimorsus]|uniref:Sulfurtransferase n=1 Tax=Vandammella animalimorsus TaxID=2029117 RepID=A0A2A2T4D9_9BURK|nr:sulfurtransferase [Vandammella animalimorsus]PAT31364.1 sulfurtransferase [Vandammella animalimorsus]PAX16355.1 sulfurtransferase [Vandammella animalimorsus]PAX18770.1 sulfurtransferase [Vandammella animalimorsus]